MSKARVYARNLLANWVGYGANLVVMFFMSPFVVHRLGDVGYGVWALLISVTGYLGLVELGMRASLGRFVNFYLGREDAAKVNGVINTSLAAFAVAGILLLVASGVLGALLGTVFPKIPERMLPSARVALMLVAVNLWLSFTGSVFLNLLAAHDRFDLRNAVDLGVLVVRSTGTVLVLLMGYGLVELALVHVAGGVLAVAAFYLLSRREFPALRLHPRLASWERFRELCGFGVWAFLGRAAGHLIYTADTVVIAILLGPNAVTYYSIGGLLLMRANGLVHNCASIFSPQVIKDCAREDWKSLRALFRHGSTMTVGVGILVLVGLIVFGKEFIILWMGPTYHVSYPVLLILAVSFFPVFTFESTGAIYAGLNRVRLDAVLGLIQGIINLALSVGFVVLLGMGIEGVAWGTFYPRLVFVVLGGALAMRWIRFPWRTYLSEIALRGALLTVVFGAISAGIALLPLRQGWDCFFLKIGLAVLAYVPLAWAALPSKEAKARLTAYLAGKFLRRPLQAVAKGASENVRDSQQP